MTPNRPYLVGLTGGIACGKSNLSAALKAHGVVVIDADEISRGLTADGGAALPKIRQVFGETVFEGQTLNRQALSQMVFGHEENLQALNALMHPLVFEEMEKRLKHHQDVPALVADVPLLYETGYDSRCDEVWCAWAPEHAQIKRLLGRGLSREQALERINSQMPAMEKAKRADHVIITTSSKLDSARAVLRLWDALSGKVPHV